MKHNKPTEDHHKPGEQRLVSGDIKVHGAVQVFDTEDSIGQHKSEREDDKTYKDATKGFEKSYLLTSRIIMVITALYFVATLAIFWQSKRSADVADATLKISQGANVAIGRKDGTVAEFILPKDPKDNAGIVIYFQNSGHLPAKFNWGTNSPILSFPTAAEYSSLKLLHHFEPMIRTRNPKDGSTQESGTHTIAGDSLFVTDVVELPRELANPRGLFVINGIFEYCDAFGKHSARQFQIFYQGIPYDRFTLASEYEITLNYKFDPKLEYLPPCETLR